MSSVSRFIFLFSKNSLMQGGGERVAYSIVYGMTENPQNSSSKLRRFALTAGMFLLFLWCVSSFWPEGSELLKVLLVPGDSETTIQAAEVFAQELSSGFSLADASKNFCITVLEHGYSG